MGRIKDLPEQNYGLLADQEECLVIDGKRGTRKVPTGRMGYTTIGENSWAFGKGVSANGKCSHAEGYETTAYDYASHAEGYRTIAGVSHDTPVVPNDPNTIYANHAEGYETTASGRFSHVEGYGTTASGVASHAGGQDCIASGNYSFSHGLGLKSIRPGGVAFGKYNLALAMEDPQDKSVLAVGWGSSSSVRADIMSLDEGGKLLLKTGVSAPSGDYAEFFEWSDGNQNEEDRVGKFVTFDKGNKIRIADQNDDYILGIVSAVPCVCGNEDCSTWNGIYLKDDFGRVLYEDTPKMREEIEEITDNGETEKIRKIIPVLDENGKQIYEKRPIINPKYNSEELYISRSDRPEWSPIGMLGVLAVYDDGTCEVNGYASVGKGGIAMKGERYRVIERVTDNIVKVVFR